VLAVPLEFLLAVVDRFMEGSCGQAGGLEVLVSAAADICACRVLCKPAVQVQATRARLFHLGIKPGAFAGRLCKR